jgi:hypothetical protein
MAARTDPRSQATVEVLDFAPAPRRDVQLKLGLPAAAVGSIPVQFGVNAPCLLRDVLQDLGKTDAKHAHHSFDFIVCQLAYAAQVLWIISSREAVDEKLMQRQRAD